MDSVTFHHDSVLSDVHMLQPRARHLMTRLNRTGQPGTKGTGSYCFWLINTWIYEYLKVHFVTFIVEGCCSLSRPRRQAPECGRDEVCPVLLSQTDPQDPEDPTEDNSESADVIMIGKDTAIDVWRGALFLADFILSEPRTFRGATVLELGGGTGLTSILTATVAKRVYCTDVGEDLLSMCRRNISLNKHMMELSELTLMCVCVWVWGCVWVCVGLYGADPEEEFSWSEEEVADLYDHTTVIIAADVVYDDDLTDAFFRTLYQLCSSLTHSCDVYISIEKRLNFTLRHLEVCCEAYEHFHHCLQQLQDLEGPVRFNAQSVAPRFPQSLIYERMDQLELWKVSATYITNLQETCTDH
uniref:Uncharacterized protein n=1 Tax=Periophthalmus magnuspinnatus TaxID=409849 RepID=A0A3B3ZZK5_9GOBI